MMRRRECEREALHAEKAIVYVADNGFFLYGLTSPYFASSE